MIFAQTKSTTGSRIARMEIQVFWNENNSQTNAYLHYSNYSYSRLIPNERVQRGKASRCRPEPLALHGFQGNRSCHSSRCYFPSCLTVRFIPYVTLTILSIICALPFLSCLMSLLPFHPLCLTVCIMPYITLTILSMVSYRSYHALCLSHHSIHHALRHSHHSIHCALLFLSCLIIPIVPLFLLGISFSKLSLPSIVHTDNELTILHQVAGER